MKNCFFFIVELSFGCLSLPGDVRQLRLQPEEPFVVIIQCETIGPNQVIVNKYLPGVRVPVHTISLDFGILAPVGPEHQPWKPFQCYKCFNVTIFTKITHHEELMRWPEEDQDSAKQEQS